MGKAILAVIVTLIVGLVCACVAVIFYSRSEGFAVLKEKCGGYMDKLKYKN